MRDAPRPERESQLPLNVAASTEPARSIVDATIATPRGEHITAGLAELSVDSGTWTATLTKLERPGVVASMFFGHRLREVILRLEDGREARGRIVATTFVTGVRECQLVGLEPLLLAGASEHEQAA